MTSKRRTLAALLLISALLPVGLRAASLGEVKTVYLFQMSNGLDQYLADRLTRDHVLQVVTDPKAADAILTDKLGRPFEDELLRLRPELVPPPPPKPKSEDKDNDAETPKDKDEQQMVMPVSTFRTAKGTVFLVHVKTQQVVWSTYEKPRRRSPQEMERMATQIAKALEKDKAPPPVKK